MSFTLLVLVALLAYANGANDNSKGVATLVGYKAARPFQALVYASIATAVGAAVSFWFSGGLLKSFGTGLFAAGAALDSRFFLAVLIGAFSWVIFATYAGLPVSTTHAITGALVGAGLLALGGAEVRWRVLGKSFALPLALSPVLALAAVYVLAGPVIWMVRRYSSTQMQVRRERAVSIALDGATAISVLDEESEERIQQTSAAADVVHWSSAGLISFARGWNDAPKIAALCLVALPGRTGLGFSIVAAAMAAGGIISGRKVLETLARKLTPLPLAQSLTASLTTAGLVCLASWNGLPVSTTQVSTGAIIGAGLRNDPRQVRWSKVTEIVLSWVITLPAAGLVAALAKYLIH